MKEPEVKAGSLLVAEPFADDPFFGRSVVLVVQHDEGGTVGFVLNKFIDYRLDELLDGFPRLNHRVGLGGPVGHTSLNFLHKLGNVVLPSACPVSGEFFWGGDFHILAGLLRAGAVPPSEIRFFLGYSGWTAGQLDREIGEGAWNVVPSSGYDLFSDCDDLWYRVTASVPKLRSWAFIPENITDN